MLNNKKIKKIGWNNKYNINSTLKQTSKWYDLYYNSKNNELKKFKNYLINKNLS